MVREILRAAEAGAKPAAAIQGESVWPLEWYLRHAPVDWGLPSAERKPAVAVVDPKDAEEAAQRLGPGYIRRDVPLRVWWLPETGNGVPTLGQLGTYLFRRIPWSPIGSQDVVVFERAGSGRISP